MTVIFLNHTLVWSPWMRIGPGSISLASSAPPVIAWISALSCTFWPLSVAVTRLPTMTMSTVCHSPAGLLALTSGGVHP